MLNIPSPAWSSETYGADDQALSVVKAYSSSLRDEQLWKSQDLEKTKPLQEVISVRRNNFFLRQKTL